MDPTEEWFFPRSKIRIRNRTVLAALTNKQSNDDGTLSDEEITFLVRRAKGGFGIITSAASHVLENGQGWPGEMGVWGDHQIPGLTKLAKGLRNQGALSLVQIFHGGMRAPAELIGKTPISASYNDEKNGNEPAREMTEDEIQYAIEAFAAAAERCEKAGIDGVEIHGAHGYLIAQFLGTVTNRRTDSWGGDLAARSRFLMRIIEEVRSRTSPSFVVVVRISPEIESLGITLDDSLELAKRLIETEIDAIHISCWDVFKGPEGTSVDSPTLTRRFREVLPNDFPLISTGSIWTRDDVQFVMNEGADLVGVGRVGIAHPDWPLGLQDSDYSPNPPPFTTQHLESVSLSPVFVEYMHRYRGFVVGGRPLDG